MLRNILVSLTFSFLVNVSFAQQNLCFEGTSGSYWPIAVGHKVKYTGVSGMGASYTSLFTGDSLQVGDKYYLKQVKTYANGRETVGYWRSENQAVYYYDTAKNAESVELIQAVSPGATWEKYDKTWKYTIIDTLSSVSTPFCNFDNLLEVLAEPQNELKDQYGSNFRLYYKRGVGMVAMKANDQMLFYAQADIPVNERDIIVYGCEDLSTEEERRACNSQKINAYISKQFKVPPGQKIKSGKIVLTVFVDTEGVIEEVEVLEGIPDDQWQAAELIRILKSFPKVIPAQAADGVPVRIAFNLPLRF
ncbi:energy transducer TonB [Penaeicola halotolerans]|uniref:energy transducer TonB n=1 Tax=Penaeicola halotolerans TaxID=2793196 RepID=UPI001CF8B5F2|nr:hypothetical protein [Penaeicola halotolerans]